MIISDAAISHRATVYVLVLALVVAGGYCYVSLPREAAPDIEIPYIIVTTPYPGVSPADVESEVTVEIEKKLKGLRDVEEITSTSVEGMSHVIVEFTPHIDIDDARQRVRDKVDEAKAEMPSDVEEPAVSDINFGELPIMNVSISGPIGLVRLKGLAENLEDDVEHIDGVLSATVVGGREREIRVEVDVDRLQVYDIPLAYLLNLISQENVNVSGGSIEAGKAKFQVRVPSQFDDPADIFGLVLYVDREGNPVYLADIARIVDDFKDETSRSRINGVENVSVVVSKRTGENVVRIADDVRKVVAQRQERAPAGVLYEINSDQSEVIRMMVSDLENNVISGLILVVLVLFLFISARNSFFIALAIPLSMFIGFTVLYVLGITLNMVVLFSLILALGMLVDNAIVIVENIYRHAGLGKDRISAAKIGTAEVAWPVITSTATTVAAFGPLLLWEGIIGEFMAFLPKTVIITLLASLFVAMVINPTLCSSFLRVSPRKRGARQDDPSRPAAFRRGYEWLLGWSIRARWLVLPATLVIYVAVVAWYQRKDLGVEFFPDMDPAMANVNVKAAEGTSLAETNRIIAEIEQAVEKDVGRRERMLGELMEAFAKEGVADRIGREELERLAIAFAEKKGKLAAKLVELARKKADASAALGEEIRRIVAAHNGGLDDVEFYASSIGYQSGGFSFTGPAAATSHQGSVTIDFVDRELRLVSSRESVDALRERLADIHGAEVEIAETQEGPPTEKPVNVEISGDDFAVLEKIAEQVKRIVRTVPGVVDLRDDYEAGRPELRFHVDRQRAALLGLTSSMIAETLKAAVRGIELDTYREGGEDFDITLQLPAEQRNNLNDVLRLRVPDNAGNQIPLSSVARLSYEGGQGTIRRVDEKRTITVSSEVQKDYNSAKVLEEVRARLAPVAAQLPRGYRIEYTGENEEQDEAGRFLMQAFLVAVAIMSMILITQFNSISLPFIIMISVALSLMGVFIGLIVLEQPFGIIMVGVAVISLAGVVVNNAIVLIDYTERLRRRGLPLRQAIIEAGSTRLRPVLLTAVTTILGLLPMAVGVSVDFRLMFGDLARRDFDEWRQWIIVGSDSAQWWGPMATSIIFGLAIATVLTLIVVPVLYSVFTQLRFRLGSLDETAA